MGFKAGELRQANAQYLELEKRISAESLMDTVLVSVEHVTLLQRAYPNYFLDTRAFVDVVQEALAATRIRRRRKTSGRQFALT